MRGTPTHIEIRLIRISSDYENFPGLPRVCLGPAEENDSAFVLIGDQASRHYQISVIHRAVMP